MSSSRGNPPKDESSSSSSSGGAESRSASGTLFSRSKSKAKIKVELPASVEERILLLESEFAGYLLEGLRTPKAIDRAVVERDSVKMNGCSIGITPFKKYFSKEGEFNDDEAANSSEVIFVDRKRVIPIKSEYKFCENLSFKELLIVDAVSFDAGFKINSAHPEMDAAMHSYAGGDIPDVVVQEYMAFKNIAKQVFDRLPQCNVLENKTEFDLSVKCRAALENKYSLIEFIRLREEFVDLLPEKWRGYFKGSDVEFSKDHVMKSGELEPKAQGILRLAVNFQTCKVKIANGEISCKEAYEQFIMPELKVLEVEAIKAQGRKLTDSRVANKTSEFYEELKKIGYKDSTLSSPKLRRT